MLAFGYVTVFILTILFILVVKSVPHELAHAWVLKKMELTPSAVILFCKTRSIRGYTPIEEPLVPLSFDVGRLRLYVGYRFERGGCTAEDDIKEDIECLGPREQIRYLAAGARGELLFCLAVALVGVVISWWLAAAGIIIAGAALVMVAAIMLREFFYSRYVPSSDAGRIRAIRSGGTPYDHERVAAT